MKRILVLVFFCLPLAFGCHPSETPPSNKKPGVHVEIEPKRDANSGKVKVNAPGVSVDVEKKTTGER